MADNLQARAKLEEEGELKALDTGDIDTELLLTEHDREIVEKFDELKRWSYGFDETMIALEGALKGVELPETRLLELIRNLRSENKQMAEMLYAPIFEHSVQSLQKIYDLKQQLEQRVQELDTVHARLEEIRSMPLYRLGSTAVRGLRKLRPQHVESIQVAESSAELQTDAAGIRPVAEEHSFYSVESPYADVDNSGTPLSIFKNWVTVFHFDERRYGSSEPLVSDRLETFDQLHEEFPLQDKRILEIGPLEGGNTKQMIDLGASQVCAIEFNKELFLKCLLVKNSFQLRKAEFVFGDCNAIMSENEFFTQRQFDLCVASGVLYHMEDPIATIDLLCQAAPAVYVWTHVASDRTPSGPWVKVKDEQGRMYRGRRNEYQAGDALGGVGHGALWLQADSMYRAFEDRGFTVESLGSLQNYKGDVVKFIAKLQ